MLKSYTSMGCQSPCPSLAFNDGMHLFHGNLLLFATTSERLDFATSAYTIANMSQKLVRRLAFTEGSSGLLRDHEDVNAHSWASGG